MSFGEELFTRWEKEKEAFRKLFPEPIHYYIDDEEVTQKEFYMATRNKNVKSTHTFPPEEASIIAFAVGKDDLDPDNVTHEEIAYFMLNAITDRIDLCRAGWLEAGGEKYAQP